MFRKQYNLKSGLIVATILSTNNLILYHSQQARCYSLVLLLVVLSSYLLFTYLSNKKLHALLLLSLVNFLIIYTHYIAAIIIPLQFLFIFFADRSLIKNLTFALIIDLILVGLRFTKKQYLNILGFNKKGDFWLEKPDIKDLYTTFEQISNSKIIFLLFILSSIFFIVKFLSKKINFRENQFHFYCLIISISSIIIPFFISQFKPLFLSRYFIFTVPFVIGSIVLTMNMISNAKISLILFVCLIYVNLSNSTFFIVREENYRSNVQLLKSLRKQGDLTLINTKDNLNLFCYYYKKEWFLLSNSEELLKKEGIYGVNDTSSLINLPLNDAPKVFLLQQFHNFNNENNLVLRYLQKSKNIRFHIEKYHGIEFSILTKKI